MGLLVGSGAVLQCTFGAAPGTLLTLPGSRALSAGMPPATIQDSVPFVNISSFGTCTSLGNPTVAAASAAALGALIPMPCAPATGPPWAPGCPTVIIGGVPALNATSRCICAYGGVISVTLAGQFRNLVP